MGVLMRHVLRAAAGLSALAAGLGALLIALGARAWELLAAAAGGGLLMAGIASMAALLRAVRRSSQ